MKKLIALSLVFALAFTVIAADPPKSEPVKFVPQVIPDKFKSLPAKDDVAQYLQDISVTIRAGTAEGSGVITNVNGTNYVWTAAHVVRRLRTVHSVVDNAGSVKVIVEFKDAEVIKKDVQDGRTVGQWNYDAEIIRYSDADYGEDLALLRVRKKNLSPYYVHFYLDEKIPRIGTELWHVGSLLGEDGSNSMTSGIVSQLGRVINNQVYDQTSATAFPGSSGGGVFLHDGRYMGMLVRGSGETFNLTVPMRRLQKWAAKAGVDFTLDPKLGVPPDEVVKSKPVEDNPRSGVGAAADKKGWDYLIKTLPAVEK